MTHMAAACPHMSERSYAVICSIAINNDTGRRQEGQTKLHSVLLVTLVVSLRLRYCYDCVDKNELESWSLLL